jgi:signal transduction histidine kinase
VANPCGRRRNRRHHRGLRGRLAWAFIGVALITMMLTSVAIHTGMFGDGHGRPWNFRLLFAALPVAGAAGVFTARVITRRLNRLYDAVERLDLRDLSLRVPVEGNDEVAALARAFNRMVDRLAAEERVRRQFFADVAHELRHPLAVQKGRLEMMQDGLVPLNAEQILRLQDGVITLTRLVDDVRDLSLAEVGRLSLNLAPLDVGELIADLVDSMEPVAADKQIALVADVAPVLPKVDADADRIRQVLVNLLANALHYTPPGGRVAVRAWADGQAVTVQVSDTGPGIAPADLAQIFDRFFRADKARSRATGGSGLGLAIVRSLVALHGGTVRAESSPGAGSTFVVTLPVGRA